MALSSMTGFARGHGVAGTYAWAWELKSVNAKGLDLKLRLPPGWDAIEAPVRRSAAERLARGSVFANLAVDREGAALAVRVNEPVLAAVLATLKNLAGKVEAAPRSKRRPIRRAPRKSSSSPTAPAATPSPTITSSTRRTWRGCA